MGKYAIRILKENVTIRQNGQVTTYNTGDWVEVGRMEAMSLVSDDKAELLNFDKLLNTDSTGIYAPESELAYIETLIDIPTIGINPCPVTKIHSDYNLFLDSGYCFKDKKAPNIIRNPSKFAFIYEYLHDFDIVLILRNYAKTVADYGRELEASKKHTFDNRVMSYQTCVVGIQKSKSGIEFYEAWQAEKANGEFNALVRALFIVKPTVYYLPPNWGLLS